jgi:DNA processing protein
MASPLSASLQTLQKDDELYWLALRMVPGLGTRKAGILVQTFRTPQAIFRASKSELQAAGLSAAVAQSIASGCAFEDAVTQQQKITESNTQVIPITDARYPPRLKDIFDPPPILYCRGRIDRLQSLMLGIVGTRRPTSYGTTAAARLARDLSNAGMTISSGMARGIDTAAHKAVLEAGGDTIAVFGCGVDEVYPAENRKLAAQIIEKGLVISEYAMGTPPYPQNFPVRNRIISGMSAGILVVEGGEYSGSSITAKLAVEQDRQVFAVPGNITSKQSWGPNLLIKQGAKLVQEWNDVLTELPVEDRRRLTNQMRNRMNLKEIEDAESFGGTASSVVSELGHRTGKVLLALKTDSPISLDDLLERVPGMSSSDVLTALFELEMAGMVRQIPGKQFLRVWTD